MKSKRWGLVFVWLALGLRAAFADDTGYKNPASAAGQFSNPGNVLVSDNARASDGTPGDTMAAYDFSFNVPADAASIDGILVEVESRTSGGCCSDVSGCQTGGELAQLNVRLSWNGGSDWTSNKGFIDACGSSSNACDAYRPFGGPADTWGRTWSVSETNSANFRCGLIYFSEDCATLAWFADHVRIKIFYTPAAGGLSPRRNRLFRD